MNTPQSSVYDYHFYDPESNLAMSSEVIELINYFGFFKHPLKADELYKFLPAGRSIASAEYVLEKMKTTGTIKKCGEYYLMNEAPENCLQKRIKGESLASKLLPKARRAGRFISLFPFVKFVGISGSLSKNYADENTDFDFFIITANNTLWICRSILHIVKKLSFLIGKQHSLCMNYFIDEHHLKIEEKNIFTRIELSTLIPVYNDGIYKTFILRNSPNLPNIQHLGIDFNGAVQYDLSKHNHQNSFWKPLNIALMKLTDFKWRRKWEKKNYPMENYDLAFKTTPFVSKNHPKNYQKKILQQLQKMEL